MKALSTPMSHPHHLVIVSLLLLAMSTLPAFAQTSVRSTVSANDVMLAQLEKGEQSARTAESRAAMTEAEWRDFSDAVAYQLTFGLRAMQERAMQAIILYGDQLDVEYAACDLAKIFHSHDDPALRRMAAVTLGRMQSDVGVRLLGVLVPYESEAIVRKTAEDVIAERYHRL